MTLEEEVIALRTEVASLKEQLVQLLTANAQLQAQLDKFRSDPPSPSFIKPSTPKSKEKAQKRSRRKRAKGHNPFDQCLVLLSHPASTPAPLF